MNVSAPVELIDPYIEMSLNARERVRRSNTATRIDIIGSNEDTPAPYKLVM